MDRLWQVTWRTALGLGLTVLLAAGPARADAPPDTRGDRDRAPNMDPRDRDGRPGAPDFGRGGPPPGRDDFGPGRDGPPCPRRPAGTPASTVATCRRPRGKAAVPAPAATGLRLRRPVTPAPGRIVSRRARRQEAAAAILGRVGTGLPRRPTATASAQVVRGRLQAPATGAAAGTAAISARPAMAVSRRPGTTPALASAPTARRRATASVPAATARPRRTPTAASALGETARRPRRPAATGCNA